MSEPQISSDVAVVGPRDVDTVTPDICPPLRVRSFGLTDPGKVREINQDQFLIAVLVKALQVERTSLPQPKVQHSSDRSHITVVVVHFRAASQPDVAAQGQVSLEQDIGPKESAAEEIWAKKAAGAAGQAPAARIGTPVTRPL